MNNRMTRCGQRHPGFGVCDAEESRPATSGSPVKGD